jgi:glycosyltransferase involved in cell wall biosynthesis
MVDSLPLISVIVPAYNAESTLADTLRSVRNQTYPNIEILVVDDGSTDETAQITSDFASRDSRINLLSKPNGGVASARNFGISHSRGDYIAPIDADDLWHPTKLAKQIEVALRAEEPLGFVYAFFRRIDAHGNVVSSGPTRTFRGGVLHQHVYTNFVGNGSSLLLRKSAVLEAGGYDERLRQRGVEGCEDILLQLRIAWHHPIGVVPEYLIGYRQRADAMSANHDRMFRSWLNAFEIFREECGDVPQQVYAWNIGMRCFELAMTKAKQRKLGALIGLSFKAIRLDPARTFLQFRYRLARFANSLIHGTINPAEGPYSFFTCSEIGEVPSWPDRVRRPVERIRLLDDRRLRLLAQLDQRA